MVSKLDMNYVVLGVTRIEIKRKRQLRLRGLG